MRTIKLLCICLLLLSACFGQVVATGGRVAGNVMVSPSTNTLVIQTITLPAGTVGAAYSQPITVTGGTGTISCAVSSGTLPPGLSLASCTVSGTPTAAGNFQFSVTATDSGTPAQQAGPQSYTVSTSCDPLSITTPSPLPQGTNGSPYSLQMSSSGGNGADTWQLAPGSNPFPTGVSISSDGIVSGTPIQTGVFTPTIQVTDSCTPAQTVSNQFSFTTVAGSTPLAITTTSPLPPATQNQLYRIQVQASGGTNLGYAFSISAGALPTGLSMSSGGLISGTPTATGLSTFTIHLVDSGANSANLTNATMTVNPAGTADNRYCNANETSTMAQDGPAAPLQQCFRTALADTPSPGSVKWVCPVGQTKTGGGSCDFSTVQAGVNGIAAGQTLIIKSTTTGTPSGAQNVYPENVTVPATQGTATNWITVRTDQITGLPPEGTRLTPCWAGITSLPGRPSYTCPAAPGVYVPKIVGQAANKSAIQNTGGSAPPTTAFWRWIGIEVTTKAGVAIGNKVIQSGGNSAASNLTVGADHILWDRMLVHGGDSPTGQSTVDIQGGIKVDHTFAGIIDSWVYDVHCITTCVDSQAFAGGNGNNPQGPIKSVDNFLESSGETWIFGGCCGTTTPTDLEIRRNHSFKPLFWKVNDPSYYGTKVIVKNLGELKNANRVLYEGNIFQNNWGGQSDQFGNMLLFTPKNPNNACPTCFMDNVTVRYNYGTGSQRGPQLGNVVASAGGFLAQDAGFFTMHDNVFDDINGSYWTINPTGACCTWGHFLQLFNDNTQQYGVHDALITHNTVINTVSSGTAGTYGFVNVNETAVGFLFAGIEITNNIASGGIKLIGPQPSNCSSCSSVANLQSSFVSSTAQGLGKPWCFDHNGLMTAQVSGQVANLPFPTANPVGNSCASTAGGGNLTVNNYSLAGFVNLVQNANGGFSGGDYHLCHGLNNPAGCTAASPFAGQANDGKDMGADVTKVNQAIAGVN